MRHPVQLQIQALHVTEGKVHNTNQQLLFYLLKFCKLNVAAKTVVANHGKTFKMRHVMFLYFIFS